MSYSLVPLHNQCRWADGTSAEPVPGYVNQVIGGCPALALLVLAVPAARRHRRGTAAG